MPKKRNTEEVPAVTIGDRYLVEAIVWMLRHPGRQLADKPQGTKPMNLPVGLRYLISAIQYGTVRNECFREFVARSHDAWLCEVASTCLTSEQTEWVTAIVAATMNMDYVKAITKETAPELYQNGQGASYEVDCAAVLVSSAMIRPLIVHDLVCEMVVRAGSSAIIRAYDEGEQRWCEYRRVDGSPALLTDEEWQIARKWHAEVFAEHVAPAAGSQSQPSGGFAS